MLRVISGTAKGFPLKVPQQPGVRPATDLVRGSIFSMLENLTDDWSRVLDLYSGSGSMGIEALSRGAEWADFVDRSRLCCSIIKENLEKTRFSDRAHVYCTNVLNALSFFENEYSIVLMDPPYKDTELGKTMEQVGNSKVLKSNVILVTTHSPRVVLDKEYGSLTLVKEHRHGDSVISIYEKKAE